MKWLGRCGVANIFQNRTRDPSRNKQVRYFKKEPVRIVGDSVQRYEQELGQIMEVVTGK